MMKGIVGGGSKTQFSASNKKMTSDNRQDNAQGQAQCGL